MITIKAPWKCHCCGEIFESLEKPWRDNGWGRICDGCGKGNEIIYPKGSKRYPHFIIISSENDNLRTV